MKKIRSEETVGELSIFVEVVIYSLFPVVITYASGKIPPIFYAAVSILLASVVFFFYLLFTKKISDLFHKRAFLYSLGVTLFIIVGPNFFIFVGNRYTTSINTAIFLQMELLFTFIICGLFFKEKITVRKVIAALCVFFGALVVLYSGNFNFNQGDLLIVLGTFFYPWGNMFAKKAMRYVSPSSVLFIRSFLGGSILLSLSFLLEGTYGEVSTLIERNIGLIFFMGVIIYFFCKLLWYEGIRRLDLTKAISIGLSFPALSLIFSVLFLGEQLSWYQLIGLIIIISGLVVITRKKEAELHEG